jgi:hypothetical protein
MISLAIPTHNRSDFVIESFIEVLDNPLIDEIIIVDDHSDVNIFMRLWNIKEKIGNNKIKLYRNEINLKPLLNKSKVVGKCKNDWVILLDSDNIIDNRYVDSISKLDLQEDIIYCPGILYTIEKVYWCTFNEFDYLIDKNIAKEKIEDGMFQTLLNTGNYFLNRKKYMDIVRFNSGEDLRLSNNDAMYFSYLWLLNGNKIKVVPDLIYTHRQHGGGVGGSWYANNVDDCLWATAELIDKIRKW